MKNQSPMKPIVRFSLALAAALAIWIPIQAQSVTPPESKMMMKGEKTEDHQTMMQQHQAMMADMKAQDAELAAKVVEMNSAPADKKLNLLAAIVTRLVEQRTAMAARMGTMQGEMMKCMGDSMPMDPKSPMPHPMMKGMDENKTDAK
jgi:hypothetical protein